MIEKPYFTYVALEGQAFTEHDSTCNRRFTGVSHDPLLDLRVLSTLGYSRLAVVAGPLPLAWAVRQADRLKQGFYSPGGKHRSLPRILDALYQVLGIRLKTRRLDIATIQDAHQVALPSADDLSAVTDTLSGRILFDTEIRKALQERGHRVTGALRDILQTLILKGIIGRVPSVALDKFQVASCMRCGHREVIYATCASCSSERCLYCPECASMGQARACRPLYYASRDALSLLKDPSHLQDDFRTEAVSNEVRVNTVDPENPESIVSPETHRRFEVTLNFHLTKVQEDASQLVVDFLQESPDNECLIFAVCGAGKTEVVFQGISHVLRHRGKALLAIPRSDVVAEVAPRVVSAIPDAQVLELRGASRLRYGDADIVVATTHQALRFFQTFDLVVLDEVDAFPYRGSASLHYAVKRATAPWGKTVYMTATPDRDMLAKAERGEMPLIRISARHHGRPLPEPQILRTHLPMNLSGEEYVSDSMALHRDLPHGKVTGSTLRLPEQVVAVIEHSLRSGRKMFVFVPTVELSRLIATAISASLRHSRQHTRPIGKPIMQHALRIASIHASHPYRDAYREAFRTGKIDIIVSTSILERGITVPNTDVLVLYADNERIFNTSALTQMAGRAGRTKEDTQAKVYFVARHVTASMRSAVRLIQDMNRHAAESGYLRHSDV